MMKRTPGPWEWVGNSLEGPDYRTVLEVQQLPERAYPELQTGVLVMDKGEGDRPLIAAAPDLLEALKELVYLKDELSQSTSLADRHEYERRKPLAWVVARVAIRKAEGDR